jgi:Mg/Co/Ni transporter MgtE
MRTLSILISDNEYNKYGLKNNDITFSDFLEIVSKELIRQSLILKSMRAKELKSEFHKLIDNFEDEKILNNFYEAILEYSKKDKRVDIIDELSEKQKERLMDSIEQVKEGKTMSNDQAKNEIRKWNMK